MRRYGPFGKEKILLANEGFLQPTAFAGKVKNIWCLPRTHTITNHSIQHTYSRRQCLNREQTPHLQKEGEFKFYLISN